MKLSRFTHFFPEKSLLWQAMTMESFRIPSTKDFQSVSSVRALRWDGFSGENLKALLKGKFLVNEGDDDAMIVQAKKVTTTSVIQCLYLIVAAFCNLKCGYCLYNKQLSSSLIDDRTLMTPHTAKKAIDLFSKATDGNDRTSPDYWEQITLYGGEPLLNMSCLKSAVAHIAALQMQGKLWSGISVVVNTNGTLIDEAFVQFAKDAVLEVQISIDGPEKVHDHYRRDHEGHGSFHQVMRGFALLLDGGVDVMPIITVSPDAIKSLPGFVTSLCRDYDIKRYAANVLMSGTTVVTSDYPARAAESMIEAHSCAQAYGGCDGNLAGMLDGFSHKRLAKESCGGSKKITVFPEGTLHTCQSLEQSQITDCGTLSAPNLLSESRSDWIARSRFNNETCLACPAIGGCGGGCGSGSYHATHSIHGVDPNTSLRTRTLFFHWLASQK